MLEVDERRDDLVDGDGERDFAALGDSDLFTSEAGVDARELALLNGSDLARMRLRLRAAILLGKTLKLAQATYIDLEG